MKLIEITSKDVFKNREKYYNNKQEFFLKIKDTKGLLSACMERCEDETEDYYHYYFEYYFGYNEKEFIGINDKLIEYICIVQQTESYIIIKKLIDNKNY